MPDKDKIPGSLIDAIKLRMFQKKCTYAKAAEEILKENPKISKSGS